jgi:hypothetical protein
MPDGSYAVLIGMPEWNPGNGISTGGLTVQLAYDETKRRGLDPVKAVFVLVNGVLMIVQGEE